MLFLLGHAAFAQDGGASEPRRDLFEYFRDPETWALKPDSFVIANQKYGFSFSDNQRQSAFSTAKGRIFFADFPVYEARVYWGEDGMRRVEISLYNKGDAKDELHEPQFVEFVKKAIGKIDAQFGAGISDPSPKGGARVLRHRTWDRQNPLARLEWAYVESHKEKTAFGEARVPYQAEFVRVLLAPKTAMQARDKAALTGKGVLAKKKGLMQVKENVVKNSKGDVMIENVPMVDQGQKGYCAAATAERVMRYFGHEVDEHEVAQMAATSAKGGTSIQGISESLKEIARTYGMERKEIVKVQGGKSFEDSQLGEDLKDYNAVAKRKKHPQVRWEDHASSVPGTRMISIDVQSIWKSLDPEILLESRLRQQQAFSAFKRDIRQNVDMGVPLFWMCMIGIYPEVPDVAQSGIGGHMRLIIGYNNKTGEIIYSDSWGANHAVKRMSEQQAWAMTHGVYVLKPRL